MQLAPTCRYATAACCTVGRTTANHPPSARSAPPGRRRAGRGRPVRPLPRGSSRGLTRADLESQGLVVCGRPCGRYRIAPARDGGGRPRSEGGLAGKRAACGGPLRGAPGSPPALSTAVRGRRRRTRRALRLTTRGCRGRFGGRSWAGSKAARSAPSCRLPPLPPRRGTRRSRRRYCSPPIPRDPARRRSAGRAPAPSGTAGGGNGRAGRAAAAGARFLWWPHPRHGAACCAAGCGAAPRPGRPRGRGGRPGMPRSIVTTHLVRRGGPRGHAGRHNGPHIAYMDLGHIWRRRQGGAGRSGEGNPRRVGRAAPRDAAARAAAADRHAGIPATRKS